MINFDLTRFKADGELPQGLKLLDAINFALLQEPEAFNQLVELGNPVEQWTPSQWLRPPPGVHTEYRDQSSFCIELDRNWARSGASLCLEGCEDFEIVFSGSVSGLMPITGRELFFLQLRACKRFRLLNLNFDEGRNQLMLDHCADFSLRRCRFHRAEGYGAIALNCHHMLVDSCHFESCLASGLMVLGQSHDLVIENSVFRGSRGDYNWDAGLHLCAVSETVELASIPEQCHEALPLLNKQCRPFHVVVQDCLFTQCRSQGVYLEGAINCLLQRNIMSNNNKEGICFDWGCVGNLFLDNQVLANGKRAEMTEASIAADFLQEYPLLRDGSCSLKLPGISLDNAFLNYLGANLIRHNYGGGIKMVRTAQGNIINDNRVLDNTLGSNTHVPHVNGVTLLSLGAMQEFDTSPERPALLDFLPSAHNIIQSNAIAGHSAEVFQDAACHDNDIQGIEL